MQLSSVHASTPVWSHHRPLPAIQGEWQLSITTDAYSQPTGDARVSLKPSFIGSPRQSVPDPHQLMLTEALSVSARSVYGRGGVLQELEPVPGAGWHRA